MINNLNKISKQENSMGRKEITVKLHCKGSHFIWDERLRLQYYYSGSCGFKKEQNHTIEPEDNKTRA